MNSLLDGLERYLDVTAFRQKLVSANLANIDTPGYRTRDVNFQAEFQRALEWPTATTPMPRSVPGLVARPDGNDVNIDRETLLLAETQLQYRTAVELIRQQFRQLVFAINEGKQS